MERLTYWNEEYGCWSYHCGSGEAANRLAAYEETGLTPEEFHAYWVFLEDLIGEQKASEALDRFRQIVKADRAGRIEVLPFTSGRTLLCEENIDSLRLMKKVKAQTEKKPVKTKKLIEVEADEDDE